MACPKCGHKTTFRERICPGCGWFAEAGRAVALAPPRAPRLTRWLRPRRMPRLRQMLVTMQGWSDSDLDGRIARTAVRGVRLLRLTGRVLLGVSRILPGLGLIFDGHFVLGALAIAVVIGCLVGAMAAFSPNIANVLIGAALSAHVASVFWALPEGWRRTAKVRAKTMTGVFCAVGYVYLRIWNALVYQPAYNQALQEAEARQNAIVPRPGEHVYVHVQENWDFGGQDIIQLAILAAFVFILMSVVGMFFSADDTIPATKTRRRDEDDADEGEPR